MTSNILKNQEVQGIAPYNQKFLNSNNESNQKEYLEGEIDDITNISSLRYFDFQPPLSHNSMSNNIFIDTVSRFRNNTTVQELVVDFKDQIKLKIFKRTTLQPQNLIKKFHVLQRRYAKNKKPQYQEAWQENERKVFIWFILAYSRLHFKKLSQINDKQWNQISASFGFKNVLLMKYESKCLQRNSQRVRWTQLEENVLKSCIESQLNGHWSQISKVLFFKTQGEHFKTAKQCRQHWFNHLNGSIKRGQWTINEDLTILQFVLKGGHHWSRIVQNLNHNRTEHMVKNRFGSLLTCSKKLITEKERFYGQNQLIELLIKQLRSNRQKMVLESQAVEDQSKESRIEGTPIPVKIEQKQYQEEIQLTEKQINHKKEREVKITEKKQNFKDMVRGVVSGSSTNIAGQITDKRAVNNANTNPTFINFLPPFMPSYPSCPSYYYPQYFPHQISTPSIGPSFYHFLTGLEPQLQSHCIINPMGFLNSSFKPQKAQSNSNISNTTTNYAAVKEETRQ